MKEIAKGFTLIELLVVVGIIGLLATMAIVSYGNAQIRSRDGKRVADMRSVISAFNAAALAEAQPILCAGNAALPAGQTLLNAVQICSNNSCSAANCTAGTTDVTKKYINFSTLHDPSRLLTACTNPSMAMCDYAIQGGASISSQAVTFTINFWTEGLSVAGLNPGQAHSVNENGLQ